MKNPYCYNHAQMRNKTYNYNQQEAFVMIVRGLMDKMYGVHTDFTVQVKSLVNFLQQLTTSM